LDWLTLCESWRRLFPPIPLSCCQIDQTEPEMTAKSQDSAPDRPDKNNIQVFLSHNARANLELRSISVSEVERAVRSGVTTRVDDKTGHLVYAVDDQHGGIRVVAEKSGDTINVLTAMRPEEFLEHAG
jgi:hypothetical protein